MRQAGKVFRQKLMAVMSQDVALMLDPVGIEPVTLCDTPGNIYSFIIQSGRDTLIHPIRNARVAHGDDQLLLDLQGLLENLKGGSLKEQGLADLTECFKGYPPLKLVSGRHGIQIDLKKDLARPLTFCLNGLAKFYNLRTVGIKAQAVDLCKMGVMSTEVLTTVTTCSDVLERYRVTGHLVARSHGGDHMGFADLKKIPGDLMEAIQGINCLQHMACEFIDKVSGTFTGFFTFSWTSPFLGKSVLKYYRA
jgi:hypothetical protein